MAKTEKIQAYVTTDVKRELAKKAEQQKRSISDMAGILIETAIQTNSQTINQKEV